MVSTTITFKKDNVQPPVYIAGEFTSWRPIQMVRQTSAKDGQPKHSFFYTADIQPGDYQYKFRLGDGDWWVFDESASTGAIDVPSDDDLADFSQRMMARATSTTRFMSSRGTADRAMLWRRFPLHPPAFSIPGTLTSSMSTSQIQASHPRYFLLPKRLYPDSRAINTAKTKQARSRSPTMRTQAR
jgi:hypothetical protein